MCGQSTAYNTYATMPTINPIFMDFSGYQNILKEIIFYNSKRLMAFQKSVLHLGISVPGCFFKKAFYVNCDKINNKILYIVHLVC